MSEIVFSDPQELHKRIVRLRDQAETTFLSLAEALYFMCESAGYTKLGYPTFEAYLADPDVDISRRTAYMLKGIYETFVIRLEVQPLHLLEAGTSKLAMIRPVVDEQSVSEWLPMAQALSRSDLKAEVRAAQGKNGAYQVGEALRLGREALSMLSQALHLAESAEDIEQVRAAVAELAHKLEELQQQLERRAGVTA